MERPRAFPRLAIAAALGACAGEPTTALFDADDPDDFYALPFPNDVRRKPDGTLDLARFPTNSLIVDSYRAAAERLDGFGLNQAVYARFDGALDPASLPDPAASVTERASVYLVDVDPASPARGERTPIIATFRAAPTQTLGGDHLVVRPFPGFGLVEGTTYALVVTRRVRGGNGDPVLPAAAFVAARGVGGDAAIDAAYAPLWAWLDEPGGDERADVVSATVFTTQRATAIVPAVRRAVLAAPAPVAADVMQTAVRSSYDVFTGAYEAPNFQVGDVPYRNPPSGRIEVDGDAAVVQRMERMRFALTVPHGDTPAAGWPVALYQHGTGGGFQSFIGDGTAEALALRGIAVISTDQVLHGPRNPGGDAEIDYFNFSNPYAMRDNAIQGVADAFSQLRLVHGLTIEDEDEEAGTTRTITFDPARVYFFGHSQGGLTGPGFVAFEPSVTGAVFSGTGGILYLSLLAKTKPLDIPMLVETFVRDDPIDEDNPTLAMVQMWVERSDGANYAPLMARRPPPGEDGQPLAPSNVFQTEGFYDLYTPNPAIQAFAVALGADVVDLPGRQDVAGLALRGGTVRAAPFSGNLGGVTVALGQYAQRQGSDGHFVVFDIAAASRQTSHFLGTLAATGTAVVVAP